MTKLKIKSFDAAPGQTKVWKTRLVDGGPEVTLIRVPISSTTVDRDGDEFSPAGLLSVATALQSGKVPLYLDHGDTANRTRPYAALDMLGAWIKGEIEDDILYGTAFLEPGNWTGETLAHKIETGLPIGFSVGFQVNAARDKPNGGLIFDDVSLWEVSAVGIPSNPDAVNSAAVAAAIKSLRIKAGLDTGGDPVVKPDKEDSIEKDQTSIDPGDVKVKTTKPCPDEDEDDRKQPEDEEEDDEEEKQPIDDDDEDEEEDEEEKTIEILDERAFRAIVAEEVKNALKPIADRLASIDEILTKEIKTTKHKVGPRAIVIARDVEPAQKTKTADPGGEPDIIIP
jgi:AAA ATPase containing von Willebrand factor type A (vWA) domain